MAESPSMADPTQPPPAPKQKWGCLRILAIAAAFGAAVLLVVGILIWQSVSWVKHAAEPTAAVAGPAKLSPGEEEDVERIIRDVNIANRTNGIFDEHVKPEVVARVFERIIEEEKKKGTADAAAPLGLRAALTPQDMQLKFSTPATDFDTKQPIPNHYFNGDVSLQLEIQDGVVTQARIARLTLAGKESPWLARVLVNRAVRELQEQSLANKDDPKNELRAVKLFKRDGDRIHVTIDGSKMKK